MLASPDGRGSLLKPARIFARLRRRPAEARAAGGKKQGGKKAIADSGKRCSNKKRP